MNVEGSRVAPDTGRDGELDFGRAEWESGRLITVPVDQVRQDPEQPRKHFDEESLRELGASLRVIQVQPIVVRRDATGWVLVDGERRWRAARGEGLPTLEAREMALTERVGMVSMVIQLAANTHRDQLTLEEQANGVLRIAEGGFPISAIARVLGHHEDYVLSLLAIARSGDARELIAAGRLTSVAGWDAYLALEPAVRKRVLDSTDPVTADRCVRMQREHELAERAKQLRLVMPRQAVTPPAPATHGGAARPTEPVHASDDAGGEEGAQSEDADGARESGERSDGGQQEPAASAGKCASAPAARPAAEEIPPRRTFGEALDAFHLEAHEERDALIAGLDGVREGLDTLLTTMGGSPEVTDPVFQTLREALVPVQRVLDAALKKVVRPPEFPPCCVLNAAARHAERDACEEVRP
jgi:ParB family chromosome partitioning protein